MKIIDIDVAIRIYYENSELGNKEISQLFGARSSATFARLKKAVMEKMIAEDIKPWTRHAVNTKIAYEVWGIDIYDLEVRRNKLIKLGLRS